MDRRTKILTAFFGALIGYALVAQVVYPQWIKPLLTIDDRVAERGKVLDKLERGENEVERAKAEYRGYAERCGSLDIDEVEIEAKSQLNRLIGKHGIQGSTMSAGRPTQDSKSGIARVSLDFGGDATLVAAVALLKDLAELPFVGRLSNVKLSKIGGSRASRDSDRVNLNVSFELMVPPQQKLVGTIDKTNLKPRESYVRHENRNYANIWERKPFTEHEPTKPLAVTMKPKTLNPKVNSPAALQAVVSGGNGDYKFAWSPAEGLSDAAIPNPKVDTATPGTKVFTLTVTDARGQTASESITVTVQEALARKDPPKEVEPPPPPVKEIPQPWADGRFMQIFGAWSTIDGVKRTDELAVYNNKSRSTDYYKTGDKFDGGELVCVHQRGAVGRRNDEYFLYPIGMTLDCAIAAAEGANYPDLFNASQRHQAEHPPVEKASDATGGTAQAVPPPSAAGTTVEDPTLSTDWVGPPSTLAGVSDAAAPGAGVGAGTLPPDRGVSKGRKQRTGSMGSSRNSARKPAGTDPAAGGENANRPPNEKKPKEQAPPTPE